MLDINYPQSIYKRPEPMEMIISTPKISGSICRINVTGEERNDVRAIDGGKDHRNHALGICDILPGVGFRNI